MPWQRARAALERTDLRWLVFALILLNTLSIRLDGGEEQYFAFAKAFVHPEWMPGSLSLRDVPGSRILFDSAVGWLLGFTSFEQVAVAGRALCALLLALPLARLFRRLALSHLASLCLLQFVCLLSHQSFFGKEWMIGAFESKVIAYAFVIASLALRLERRNLASVMCAAAAVWFHVLVGGWYGIGLFLHLLLSREPWRRTLAHAAAYAVLVAPTALYIGAHYLSNNPNVIDGIAVSRIYVYFRNPHHLDLIGQLRHWGSLAQAGLVLSLLSSALCARLLARSSDELLVGLSLFGLVFFAQQFLSLAVAPFDQEGVFLKYYPYRTSSLSLLVMLLILMRLWSRPDLRQALPPGLRFAGSSSPLHAARRAAMAMAFLGIALGIRVAVNMHESWQVLFPPPAEASRLAMYAWIRDHTPRDAVFLDLEKREPIDFIRRTERESYAVYKFDPTTNRLILDWYLRVLERNRAMADPRHALVLAGAYRVDYVLTQSAIAQEGFRLVHHEPGHDLYALQRPAR